jgi:predicted MFS family arabinose efflux permease
MVLGVYATFASLGRTVGSLMLGVLAETLGLSAVFHATGIMLALGLAGVWLMGRGGRDCSANIDADS